MENIPNPCPGAPRWEPQKWRGLMEDINNCYAYAVNDCRDRGYSQFPQPGGKAGLSLEDHKRRNAQQLVRCAELDGLQRAFVPEAKPGHYLVALAVTRKGNGYGKPDDYHWWRQDNDGFWSHKLASYEPKRMDEDGEMIRNPRTCNRGDYRLFIGYFYVPEGGLKVETINVNGPRHSIPLPQPRFR